MFLHCSAAKAGSESLSQRFLRRANAADHPFVRMLHRPQNTHICVHFASALHCDLADQESAAAQMLYYYIILCKKMQEESGNFFRLRQICAKSGGKIRKIMNLDGNTAAKDARLRSFGALQIGSVQCGRLCLLGRTDRTCIRASAALDAGVCVDHILAVALGDCADGAGICASTARDACIADLICHSCLPPVSRIMVSVRERVRSFSLLYHISEKNQGVLQKYFYFIVLWFNLQWVICTKIASAEIVF